MFYRFARFLLKIIFKIRYKLVVHGNTNLPETPLIICANHINLWDPILLAIIFDRPIRFMAKKELFENKFLGFLLEKFEAFPVDRDNVNIKTVKDAIKLVKDNEVLGIFPEGTRVKTVSEENMKTGVAMIASRAGADVIPVFINSDYKFRSKVEVFVRDKIAISSFDDVSKDMRNKEITKAIYKNIYKVNWWI